MTCTRTLILSMVFTACGPTGEVTPQEGTWDFELSSEDNICEFELQNDGLSADDTTLTLNADGTGFTVDYHDESDDGDTGEDMSLLDCELYGADFSCEDIGEDLEPWDFSEEGLDAILQFETDSYGSFEKATRGTLTSDVTVSCSGADCDLIVEGLETEELPCTTSMTYELRKR